jgi:3-hydroxyacyl-CoA dehydrogenase
MAKVACIGAGNVGRSWAAVFARAGHDVALYDVSETEIAERALPLARETLALHSANGFLDEDVDTVFRRIVPVTTIAEAVAGAEHVQESVREDIEVKRLVFGEIARHAPRDATIASSTSAIRGSLFMGEIDGPGRALVAHPVNPPALIPIVELCATPWTAPEAMERVRAFMAHAGMEPVTVLKEIDGFILNRLQYTLVAEAMHLVGEGYCSAEDIDKIVTKGLALRWASIGPFEVAHLNSTHGFLGFVEQLGPMMKQMGSSARTDYDWDMAMAERIHEGQAARTPVERIAARQAWRNRRILATRAMQDGD